MDILRLCQMRIRVLEQWWGDYLATLGAARVAEREILKLGVEYGWDRFHALERAWFDYSEARMIAAIRKLPAGIAAAGNMHDPFPGTPAEGVRIKSWHGRRIWEHPATLVRRGFLASIRAPMARLYQRGHPRCRRRPGHAGDRRLAGLHGQRGNAFLRQRRTRRTALSAYF
jgi:hypothetical protein